jgi:hypothetical protein
VLFTQCKENARVKLAKTGHGPNSTTLVVICVFHLLFVLFYVLFVCKCVLPPGDNPTAIHKIYQHQSRYNTLTRPTLRFLLSLTGIEISEEIAVSFFTVAATSNLKM